MVSQELKYEDFVGGKDDPFDWTVTKVEPFDPTLALHCALGVKPGDRLEFRRSGVNQLSIRNGSQCWTPEDAWDMTFDERQLELEGIVQLPFVPNELQALVDQAIGPLPENAPKSVRIRRRQLMGEFAEHLRVNRDGAGSIPTLGELDSDTLVDLLTQSGVTGEPAERGVVEPFTLNVKYIGNSAEYSYLLETGCATVKGKDVIMFIWNNRFKHPGGVGHAQH